jgi:hypothetical protein
LPALDEVEEDLEDINSSAAALTEEGPRVAVNEYFERPTPAPHVDK